jgi:hypothetical protein
MMKESYTLRQCRRGQKDVGGGKSTESRSLPVVAVTDTSILVGCGGDGGLCDQATQRVTPAVAIIAAVLP